MADFVQIKALLFKKALEAEVILKKGLRQVVDYVEPYAEPKPVSPEPEVVIAPPPPVDPWIVAKNALLESVPEKRREIAAILLENVKKDVTARTTLFESMTTSSPNSKSNLTTMLKVILPIITRVISSTSLFDFVGVQPMKGPLEYVYVLKRTPDKVIILKEVVEAKTRRLSLTWSLEAAQDERALRGIGLEAELLCVAAAEVVAEFEQEVLSVYKRDGDQVTATLSKGYFDWVNGSLHLNQEVTKAIEQQINSKLVMRNNNTGVFVIVSCAVLTFLQSEGSFERNYSEDVNGAGSTKFVGTLFAGKARVYVDAYARNDAPILIGYKGFGSETEAPAIYAPYVPLSSTGVVIHAQTLEPIMGFLTRYAFVETDIKDKLVSLTLVEAAE